MPGLDGRGPSGMGPGTGRRRGYFNSADQRGFGRGLGICRWMGSGTLNEKEILEQRRKMLEMELDAIENRLNNNKDTSKMK